MHLLCWMILAAAVGYSTAQYRDFDVRDVTESRDVIDNEDTAVQKENEELVACPVCADFADEECTIKKNGKRYKRCTFGTYINEACGSRRDCYRGPKERCTEKMTEDSIGAKCAHGYVCHGQLHECVGLFNDVDSLILSRLSHAYYILPQDNSYQAYIDRYPLGRATHHAY